MNSVEIIALELLKPHPFQVHIPDLVGTEWNEFLRDIRARGVQDPIRVSRRTGAWVVVDGHQRLRAAQESGYTHLSALEQTFDSEGEEVQYIAGSSRYRRNLTDAQKVGIARAQERFFTELNAQVRAEAPQNALREKRRTECREIRARLVMRSEGWFDPETGHTYQDDDIFFSEFQDELDEELGLEDEAQNFALHPAPTKDERSSTAQAAQTVGLNRETYRQGKKIQDAQLEVITQAWQDDEISTHAAYEVVSKAPEPMRAALMLRTVGAREAAAVQKHPRLVAQLEAGEIDVPGAVLLSAQMKAGREALERETGLKTFNRITSVLTSITDISPADYLEALHSQTNTATGGNFSEDWRIALSHMQSLIDMASNMPRTITVEAKAVN